MNKEIAGLVLMFSIVTLVMCIFVFTVLDFKKIPIKRFEADSPWTQTNTPSFQLHVGSDPTTETLARFSWPRLEIDETGSFGVGMPFVLPAGENALIILKGENVGMGF